jgi:hypothetical protein
MLFGAAAGIAACGPPPASEDPASASRAEQPGSTQQAIQATSEQAPAKGATEGKRAALTGPPPLVPRVSIEGEKGERMEAAQAAFEPARERMKECVPGKKGVLQVRIRTGPTRTSMDVEPSSSLGGSTSRCVLETLSTIDVDEALNRGSPSDRPQSGYSSMMRIEW